MTKKLFNFVRNKLLISFIITFFISEICHAEPAIWNVPQENHHFVGRDTIFEKIKAKLKSPNQEIVVIKGPQGFGKTQIAKRFVYKNFKKYDVVWWFRANQYLQPQFEKFVESMAAYLGIQATHPEAKEQLSWMVKDAIRSKNIKCLIIFDDASSFEDIQKYVLFSHKRSVDTIVTSKNAIFAVDTISINPFDREESIQYINQFLNTEALSAKNELAEKLRDWPAAIAVAIDYIKGYPGMTINQYLKKHVDLKNNSVNNEPNRPGNSLDEYDRNLLTTIQLSINEIRKTSEEAYKLLGFLSLLHRDEVPIAWIEEWAKDTGAKTKINDLLSIILKKSLIEVNMDHPEKGISMQELLQSIIASEISPSDKKFLVDQAARILLRPFADRSERGLDQIVKDNKVIVNAVRLSCEAEKITRRTADLKALRILTLDILVGWIRDFVSAEKLIDHIHQDTNNSISISPEHNVTYHAILGLYHGISSPDYGKAIFYQRKALELVEKTKNQYDEHLRILCNLIQHYCLTGRSNEVTDYIKKGEEISNLCEFYNYRLLFVLAKNVYLMDKAQFQRIIDLHKIYEDVCQRQSSYSPMRYFILAQLAEAYYKNGDLEEAKATIDRAEKYGREVHGDNEENMLFGRLYVLKGVLLIDKKEKFKDAKAFIERGIDIQNTNFRGDKKHRSQGFAYLQLGNLLRQNEKYEEAKIAYLKSEDIFNTVVKGRDFDDLCALYEQIIYLSIDMKDEAMAYDYWTKILETYGANHPRVVKAMLTLDHNKLYFGV